MILVTGSVVARPETLDEVRRLSLDHVHRSRTEPGCISHAVHVDCDNSLRLVFIEQWADRDALLAHFAVPASREFIRALREFAAAITTLEIYDAPRLKSCERIKMHGCIATPNPILRCSIESPRYSRTH